MLASTSILTNISRRLSHGVKQALTPAYFDLLAKLGNPHLHLPPVFHVAGTNGKGSTCAFLRSILEAAGYKVHVYTSPHLVRFHERIRIAGELIGESELVELLTECENSNKDKQVSEFEIGTAAAFKAFARHPADFTILETGLGGRLDATNVVPKPLATLITRLSYDHRDFLGDTLALIAAEKAGIMREGVPCFISAQAETESINAVRAAAAKIKATLLAEGHEWQIIKTGGGFRFDGGDRHFDLPQPALLGAHQYANAALAIAALSVLPKAVTRGQVAEGLQKVEWPARLQPLKQGFLPKFLASGQELWLDGGHNDSAGEVLAAQAKFWAQQDARPLYLVFGMLTTKDPEEFLRPLARHVAAVRTVPIPDEANAYAPEDLAGKIGRLSLQDVAAAQSLEGALKDLATRDPSARILICGSLYLAGYVLGLESRI